MRSLAAQEEINNRSLEHELSGDISSQIAKVLNIGAIYPEYIWGILGGTGMCFYLSQVPGILTVYNDFPRVTEVALSERRLWSSVRCTMSVGMSNTFRLAVY